MKPPLIIITTYWKKGNITKGDQIYDHPSDILRSDKETLTTTLRSLHNIQGEFEVLVLGVPTNFSIGTDVDSHILSLIKKLPISYPIRYFGSSDLNQLKIALKEIHLDEYLDLVSDKGYGNVRNLSLILTHLLGFEIVILIDDDEIVSDRHFLGKAMEIIGRQYKRKRVDLILGYYLNSDGSPLIEENEPLWWQLVWQKTKMMNDAFRIILDNEKPRYVLNPTFALGGLMVIHKNCWLRVAFDPLIPRGEDMDFLRNAHFLNYTTYLDKNLYILHKPPSSSPSNLREKFQQDVRRFIYSQYKLDKLGISPDDYNPYPGHFLKHIEGKTLVTELLFAIYADPEPFIEVKTREDLIKQISEIESTFEENRQFAEENSSSYLNFQKRWEAFMRVLDVKFSLNYIERS